MSMTRSYILVGAGIIAASAVDAVSSESAVMAKMQTPHADGPKGNGRNHRGKSMTKQLRLIGCLLVASLFSSLAAYGQTDTATIVGTVVDHSGAVLPNGRNRSECAGSSACGLHLAGRFGERTDDSE